MTNRTVVVGLDGATFRLLEGWLEEDCLPVLKRMCEGGVRTVLESCRPPVTSPAWKVFSTGLNPGKLGVYWWRQFDRGRGSMVSSGGSRLFDKRDVWGYLSDAGRTVGVVGVPLTFPPEPVNGAMVAGGPFSKEGGFTYPPELEDRLMEELDYRHKHEDRRFVPPESLFRKQAPDLALSKFDAGRYVEEQFDPEVLFVTTFYLNMLQHYWWDADCVRELWEEIDERIGEFLDGETNVLLVSDHGLKHTANMNGFCIGNWFVEEGYCSLSEGGEEVTRKVFRGVYSFLQKAADAIHLPDRVRYVGSKAFDLLSITPSALMGGKQTFEQEIDYERSTAIGLQDGLVYIINCSEEEREEVRNEIKRKLINLRNEGQQVIEEVYEREEIWRGEYLERAPDLYVEPAEGYRIVQGEAESAREGRLFKEEGGSGWRSTNHSDGILIAYGPDIADSKGFKARLKDIAPTLLHMHDVPIPRAMDGRVLMELFREGSEPADRERVRREVSIRKTNVDV